MGQREWLTEIASRIQVHRVRRRISQHVLAALDGTSRVTLGGIERNEQVANLRAYRKIAHALDASLSDLVSDE